MELVTQYHLLKCISKVFILTQSGIKSQIKSVTYSSQGARPVNWTSATDWQIAVRQDNLIIITLHQIY